MDFKNTIADILGSDAIKKEEIASSLAPTPSIDKGDVCLPCFRFAKSLHKSPQAIAGELKEKIDASAHPLIGKTAVEGGYLNIFLNRSEAVKEMMSAFRTNGGVTKPKPKNGKTVCIDYSSVNIAKPFHIGHLLTTVIGGSLYRIFNYLGYNAVGINHLGDWGTQFGKMIVAYLKWGDDADIEKRGVRALLDLYVRFHAEAEKDESRISTMVTLSFRYSCYMGILCIGLFIRFGKSLGTIIFHNELSGSFIMVLCWLCPFMYLATTMGSIQNGLGKTGITFLQNMFAMGIRLVFVLFAVPLFGIRGYLWGFLVSELLLAFLCCFSVRRQVEFHCNMADCVLKPGLVLLISLGLELALCTAIPVTGSFLEIVFHMGIITVCYGAFLGVILR